jgi:hypothetical protein
MERPAFLALGRKNMARDAYVIGPLTTGFFAFVPVGEFLIWLWLVIAAEIAVVLILRKEYSTRPTQSLVVLQDEATLRLLRRVVPHLRSRRPAGVIEAQQRWRQAAAARRHARRDLRQAS